MKPLKKTFVLSIVAALPLWLLSAQSRHSSNSSGASLAAAISGADQSASDARRLARPANQSDSALSPIPAIREKETIEIRNRKDLESKAGHRPATLLVRSATDKARVWIADKSVGETPLLILLAPGQYKIELKGPRMEFASRHVDLLPSESLEIVLQLKQRYPAEIKLQ